MARLDVFVVGPAGLPVGAMPMALPTDPETTVYVGRGGLYALTEEDGQRATAYIQAKEARNEEERTASHFRSIETYLQGIERSPTWLFWPFVYFGGVSMLAGIWKGGKSEFAAGLIRCRVSEAPFLGQDLPPGPVYLITEEGGISLAEKYDNVSGFEVLDRREMTFADLSLDDVLTSIKEEATGKQAFVVIDTFMVMTDVENENDSAEITKSIRKVMDFAQVTGAAVLIIDHTGKQTSGLNHGKSIRGSGAKPATLDIYGTLDYGPTQTQRVLAIEGRVKDSRAKLRFDFDPETQVHTLVGDDADQTKFDQWTAAIPMGGEGWSETQLSTYWHMSRPSAAKRAEELVRAGRMRREWGKKGNADAWLHWSLLPLVHPQDEEEDDHPE